MRTQVATTSRNYKNLLLLTEIKLLFFYGTVMTAGLHFWLSTLLKNWRKKTILNVKMGGLCVFFNLMNFCQFFRILENRRRTPFLMMSEKKIHIWKIPVMPIKENHVSYHCVQIFGIFPPKTPPTWLHRLLSNKVQQFRFPVASQHSRSMTQHNSLCIILFWIAKLELSSWQFIYFRHLI